MKDPIEQVPELDEDRCVDKRFLKVGLEEETHGFFDADDSIGIVRSKPGGDRYGPEQVSDHRIADVDANDKKRFNPEPQACFLAVSGGASEAQVSSAVASTGFSSDDAVLNTSEGKPMSDVIIVNA